MILWILALGVFVTGILIAWRVDNAESERRLAPYRRANREALRRRYSLPQRVEQSLDASAGDRTTQGP